MKVTERLGPVKLTAVKAHDCETDASETDAGTSETDVRRQAIETDGEAGCC